MIRFYTEKKQNRMVFSCLINIEMNFHLGFFFSRVMSLSKCKSMFNETKLHLH